MADVVTGLGAANQTVAFHLGDRPIGAGCETFIMAEIGVNHNGDVRRAGELVDAAARAGADAVKLQAFDPDALCSRLHKGAEREMLQQYVLSEGDLGELRDRATSAGMVFLVTPFGFAEVDQVVRLGAPAIKVGSGEVTHTPLLRYIGGKGLPVVLSTGAADLRDVERAVKVLRTAGCREIALLHCTSVYPAPDASLNLSALNTLAERFSDCVIGYSDHSTGTTAGIAAVAMGARIIEKHLTSDHALEGPDHVASAEPDEFGRLVQEIRRYEQMRGDGVKRPAECETIIGQSLVAGRTLHAGHVITPTDLTFKRPGWGLRPYMMGQVVGRRLAKDLPADDVLTREHINWGQP